MAIDDGPPYPEDPPARIGEGSGVKEKVVETDGDGLLTRQDYCSSAGGGLGGAGGGRPIS